MLVTNGLIYTSENKLRIAIRRPPRSRPFGRLALLCQVIPLGYRVTGSWQYGQRKRMTFKIAVSTSWRLISGRLGLGGGAARFSRRALFPRV